MARQPFNPDLAVGAGKPSRPPPQRPDAPMTVSYVTGLVSRAIEDSLPSTLHVVGQISNYKRHSSGHRYFTLKDDHSELSCVMWRSMAEKVKFDVEDGMDVVATGHVAVYERTGRYQLYVRRMEPRGTGALELAFRQLCERLEKEGLFDPKHKKPIPRYPRRIGVITSPTGAAVNDITNTLARRFAGVHIVLAPVRVQGPQAASEIAAAVNHLNRWCDDDGSGVDVIIAGRGGGSIEDLWAFNEEAVARAIHASRVPVISAVGHESDITIADLVADVRAATPTAAAELAVPHTDEVLEELSYRRKLLTRHMRHALELGRSQVRALATRPALADASLITRDRRKRLLDIRAAALHNISDRVHRLHRRIGQLAGILQQLHPVRYVVDQRSQISEKMHCLRLAMTRRLAQHERMVSAAGRRLTVVAPHRLRELRRVPGDAAHRLRLVLTWYLAHYERTLAAAARRLTAVAPQRVFELRRAQVDHLQRRMSLAMHTVMDRNARQVDARQKRLNALSYKSTLHRGYTITRDRKTGRLITHVARAKPGIVLRTDLADGHVDSRVIDSDNRENRLSK